MHAHDRLAARDEEVRRELDWARKVQARFLPEDLPAVAPFEVAVAYEPSMEVGGDFCGLVPLAGGNLAVVVADTPQRARAAARACVLDLEALPAIFDPRARGVQAYAELLEELVQHPESIATGGA